MRLRHVPGAEQRIEESPHVVRDPAEWKGRWAELFGNRNPVRIEIGMGKGKFLMELAAAEPRINYVGVERYSSVLLRAVQKQEALLLPNVRFLCTDALELPEIFEAGEAERIYLNFPDPWPKDRHAKRRLTSPRFMKVYDRILAKGGSVEFKTDNRELFEYSLESVSASGWDIVMRTCDLYRSIRGADNVVTEYEEKFASKGEPIYKLIAVRGQET